VCVCVCVTVCVADLLSRLCLNCDYCVY